jgi:hypothetical protein
MKPPHAHKKVKLAGTSSIRKRKITVDAEKMDLETTEIPAVSGQVMLSGPVPHGQLPCGYCGSLPGKKHQSGCDGDGDAEEPEQARPVQAPYNCQHENPIELSPTIKWCSNCGAFQLPGRDWTIPTMAYYPVEDRNFWKDANAKLLAENQNLRASLTYCGVPVTMGTNSEVANTVIPPGEPG